MSPLYSPDFEVLRAELQFEIATIATRVYTSGLWHLEPSMPLLADYDVHIM